MLIATVIAILSFLVFFLIIKLAKVKQIKNTIEQNMVKEIVKKNKIIREKYGKEFLIDFAVNRGSSIRTSSKKITGKFYYRISNKLDNDILIINWVKSIENGDILISKIYKLNNNRKPILIWEKIKTETFY